MNSNTLKTEIYRLIESLEESKLEEFYGLMINFLNSKKNDEWYEVSEYEIQGINAAIDELNSGKGTTNEEVIYQIKQKYFDK